MSDEPDYIRGSLDSLHISADNILSVQSWVVTGVPDSIYSAPDSISFLPDGVPVAICWPPEYPIPEEIRVKLLEQALAMPEIKALVDALHKSAEGWDNVIGMGLIAKKNFGAATVLRDEAIDALRRVGVEP